MNAWTCLWLLFRAIRWLACITFLAWSAWFIHDRAPHLNSFGQLLPGAEAMWFLSAVAALFAGFLELMMRERAGLQRPSVGQLMPPKAPAR